MDKSVMSVLYIILPKADFPDTTTKRTWLLVPFTLTKATFPGPDRSVGTCRWFTLAAALRNDGVWDKPAFTGKIVIGGFRVNLPFAMRGKQARERVSLGRLPRHHLAGRVR